VDLAAASTLRPAFCSRYGSSTLHSHASSPTVSSTAFEGAPIRPETDASCDKDFCRGSAFLPHFGAVPVMGHISWIDCLVCIAALFVGPKIPIN